MIYAHNIHLDPSSCVPSRKCSPTAESLSSRHSSEEEAEVVDEHPATGYCEGRATGGTLRFFQTWHAGKYTLKIGDFPIETPNFQWISNCHGLFPGKCDPSSGLMTGWHSRNWMCAARPMKVSSAAELLNLLKGS